MSFRTKLLAFFTITIIAAVGLVAWGVSVYTRRAFEQFDHERTAALLAQFRREYTQRGDEIAHRVQGLADQEATLRMAMDLNRPQADASQYYNDAHGLAEAQQLDFLDIIADDGTLISSAEWPARFGYKNDWVATGIAWNSQGAFLRRVELADSVDLGLLAVRAVSVGEKRLYLIGGQRLDRNFLATLVLPAQMRALLYRNLEPTFVAGALTNATGEPSVPAVQAERFAPLITEVQNNHKDVERTIDWGPDAAGAETFDAIPLIGRQNDLLGVLLVGSSRRSLVTMLNFIRSLTLLVGGGVILLALILGWWVSARVTRPIGQLAAGAREVAAGRWQTRVNVRSRDEFGQLAAVFNEMTEKLVEQRERLVQTERVAAWRELARRLAHELKNPLFPLQLTVENLQRAREQTSEQFDEVFFESTATLRAELENLKAIVGRFSDFAKMPSPQLEPVDLNESVRGVIKLFEPQFSAIGRPPITPELYLAENLPHPQADPTLLRRALENLVLNSLDAMPAGGTLTVRTSQRNGWVRFEITDTGAGLTPEECARLFTPYYTSKQHGTGLGLAIVQSVVSDHGGKIAVESALGAGTTFRIEFPAGASAAMAPGPFIEPVRARPTRSPAALPIAPAAAPLDAHSDAPQIVPKIDSETDYEIAPVAASELKSETAPGGEPEAVPEMKTENVSEIEVETAPEINSETVPEIQLEAMPDSKPELAADMEPVIAAETVPEIQPEAMPDSKAELAADMEPVIATETVPEIQPEAMPDSKPELAADMEPVIAAEIATEIAPEIQPEAQPEIKPIKPPKKPKRTFLKRWFGGGLSLGDLTAPSIASEPRVAEAQPTPPVEDTTPADEAASSPDKNTTSLDA